ncbi:hypothetical protein PSH55_12475 [Pseudoalteromonas sp. Angola-31]|jgi:hypothetical protein|nr:hypothetical protein [Pseudoalteromonas sp. Angola-31]
MDLYYVNNNSQTTGEHEVHKNGCNFMPSNKAELGMHSTCSSAVQKAKDIYSNVDGCMFCIPNCHTR